jgi:hypothetical protein
MSIIASSTGNIYKSQDVRCIDNFGKLESGVEFTRPENGIYCFDKKIFPFPVPLVLCGNITVVAEINITDFIRAEFYINDGLHEVIMGPGPYYGINFSWGGSKFSKTTFKIVAYLINGTQTSDEITIWRIFR